MKLQNCKILDCSVSYDDDDAAAVVGDDDLVLKKKNFQSCCKNLQTFPQEKVQMFDDDADDDENESGSLGQ